MAVERLWPVPIPVTDCWVTLGKSQNLCFRLTSLCNAGSHHLWFTDNCTRSYYSLRVFWKLLLYSPSPWYSLTPFLDVTSQNTHMKCLNTYNFSVFLTPPGHSCATDNQNVNNHRQKFTWGAMYVLDMQGKRARNFEIQILIKCLPFFHSHCILFQRELVKVPMTYKAIVWPSCPFCALFSARSCFFLV